MKTLFLLLSSILCATSFADEPPKWAEMQRAILVEADLAKVTALVASGVDPNAPIGCGTFTPLDGAISRQNAELVDLLISLGARPTESQLVSAALCSSHEAAMKIVGSLRKAGAPINAKDYYSGDKTRYTMPLHNAVWRHNTELVAYLLQQEGIQLDDTNVDGYTPLMIAVEHGQEEIVEMLLTAGANPKKKNKEGIDAEYVSARVIEKQTRLMNKIKTRNKAADSTATRVTPPADPSLRSGQE
jgi:ankyrin repeat protein